MVGINNRLAKFKDINGKSLKLGDRIVAANRYFYNGDLSMLLTLYISGVKNYKGEDKPCACLNKPGGSAIGAYTIHYPETDIMIW